MSDAALKDLSDLTDEDREALARIVEAMRRARANETPEASFARFWQLVPAERGAQQPSGAGAFSAAVADARVAP
jgi:hypothetical protein